MRAKLVGANLGYAYSAVADTRAHSGDAKIDAESRNLTPG